MLKIKKSLAPLIVGIFLLIWANDAYFILGNTGKYISLFSGFVLITFSSFWTKWTNKDFKVFLLTMGFFLTYLLIAFLQNQKTLTIQLFAFQVVCIFLFLSGVLLAKRPDKTIEISNAMIYFFILLVLIGVYAFYKKQTSINYLSNSLRDMGDESLNPIGVAYTHSLLLLFLFWILHQNTNRFLKALILVALLTTLLIILSTLSRGALIYLAFFFLLFYFKGGKITKQTVFNISKALVVIIVLTIISYFITKDIPLMQQKFQILANRFSILFSFFESGGADLSAQARQGVYIDFLENWDTYIFGQSGYKPYPHNQFLEILMRWGLFGIPLLIFSIRVFIKSFISLERERFINQPLSFLIVSLFFFCYLQSMSSTSLEMNRMLWLGLGFISYYKNH